MLGEITMFGLGLDSPVCICKQPEKKYSEAVCYLCWTCSKCGKFGGCDNLANKESIMDKVFTENFNFSPTSGTPTKFTVVKDSGAQESFTTGAVRDIQEGKGRYDLIPAYPLERLAMHYENGAKRYSDNNWCKGMPISRCLDSLLRHANKYKAGMTDEDHLSAIVFNTFAIIYYEEMIKRGLLPDNLLMHKVKDDANAENKTK